MSNIVELIKNIPDVDYIKGCTDEQIEEAEKELGLKFPQEYIDYVKAFGCVDFFGHEFTGLNIEGRLNTVNATKKEQSVNDAFPAGFFVLENLGIDAKVIIVDEQGGVYVLQNNSINKMSTCISEYIRICKVM